jgi:hypothetical protein
MLAFDLEYDPCDAVSAAWLKAEMPMVVATDVKAFIREEVADRAFAMEHDAGRASEAGPYPCGERDPRTMRRGTIGAWRHQFNPEAHRVCCLGPRKAGEHLVHPDIAKTVIRNRHLDEARLRAERDPHRPCLGTPQSGFDPKACRTPMKCAPWSACDFVSCQEQASSRSRLETRLQTVAVEDEGARSECCEADEALGFRFESGFACYREWRPRKENDVP